MSSRANKTDAYSSGWLLDLLWNYKYLLLILGIVAAVGGWAAASLQPRQYESTVKLYATNPKNNADILDFQEFGYDVDADRFMEVLRSNRIRDSLIAGFNLIRHYGIDTSKPEWRQKLYSQYQQNVTLDRTKFMSIEATVRDQDPKVAAEMANALIDHGDQLKARLLKQNVRRLLTSIEKQYRSKQREVDSLMASLMRLKQQSADRAVNELRAKIDRKNAKIDGLQTQLQDLREQANAYNLPNRIQALRKQLSEANAKRQRSKAQLEVFREQLPPDDTLRLKAKARAKGYAQSQKVYREKLKPLFPLQQQYRELKNAMDLQVALLNDLKRRIQNITAAYESSAPSTRLRRKRKAFEAELNRLNAVKTKYEKALQEYRKPIAESYVISPAEPDPKPVAPRQGLTAGATGLLTIGFAASLLVIRERFRQA